MAIAGAVLEYLVAHVQCKTLFITHYPLVATSAVKRFPRDISNIHMGFEEIEGADGLNTIAFLYTVHLNALLHLSTDLRQAREGLSTRSFGVECGKLAGLPNDVLLAASEKAAYMKEQVAKRVRNNR